MSALKSTQVRYTVFVLVYFIALVVATFLVIKLFVAPDLQRSESIIVGRNVDEIGIEISNKLHQVEAQSRAITQSVPLMDSAAIDALQPGLVDQYGDPDVFGGGIWPLPFKRDAAKERFSTFFARDASGKLQVNTHWNTPESLKYFEQTWWKAGATSPKGQCTWAKAYKDDASPQPRTNCAMAIYKNDALYGVSTIDVTLGFFNRLVADMEKKIGAQIVLVEADGKIVSNTTYIKDDSVLKSVGDLAATSPMIAELRTQLAATKGRSAVESTYDDGVAHTLFLKPIAGSPWLIATGLPTSMLTQNSDHVLGKLAMFQAPMVVILLLLIILGLRMLMKQLANLRGNIDALSSGDADLTRRLPLDSGSEFNAVANSFNTFIARLQTLLLQIQHSTTSLASAARQIAGGNLDLSSRTEEQASSLEETAASMEELTANVQQNSVHAQQAHTLARDAAKVAARGGDVVGDVVQTMGSISASSKKIVDIISVIDSIAFQTNILALNASVEAARAGEQGRGFSVVAAEVRNLAQSSAVAARDIKQLIVESVANIDAGSGMAAEAGRTITDINRSVANVAAIMGEIQAASAEQSQGIEQVNRAVTQLDDMTQQNAALVEEAAAAAKAMEEQTNLLEALVGGFRLR